MQINVALCSINPTVGALDANADLIFQAYLDGVADGADIVLTPEMSLTGYPLQDLTQVAGFLVDVRTASDRLIERIKATGHATALVFGHPTDTGKDDGNRRLVHNSATFYDPTTDAAQIVHKVELPNYGVFDEKRNYLEGPQPRVIKWRDLRIGLLICEDGWFPKVTGTLAAQGADMLLWINGSPFSVGKNVKRRQHASDRVAAARVPIAYVNLVGAQDELVFDGDCFSWDGANYVETALFEETVQVVRFDVVRRQATLVSRPMAALPLVTPTGVGEKYRDKVRGMRDYAAKTGFKKVVLGMSGGIDSAIMASICTDALGAQNVLLVRLPSGFSSSGSLVDAAAARDLLGCPMRTIVIEPVVDMLRLSYANTQFDTPEIDAASNGAMKLTGASDENAQARARGAILMSISNQEGYLLVTTGNRSEIAVGYFTLYGDSCGGYNGLKDSYKTAISVAAGRNAKTEEDVAALVAEFGPGLVQWRNALTQDDIERFGFHGPAGRTVPLAIEAKAESAELAPDQKDSNSLPFYPVLDGIIVCLVDRRMNLEAIAHIDRTDPIMRAILADARIDPKEDPETAIARGFAPADVRRVNRLVNGSEHKRRQTAPGPKVGDMLYGQDRRMPIINAYPG